MNLISDYETVSYIKIQYMLLFMLFAKYLNEKKIPAHQKDELVLLTNKNEVLWVAGYGINDKIKIKNKPTHLISLNKYKKG